MKILGGQTPFRGGSRFGGAPPAPPPAAESNDCYNFAQCAKRHTYVTLPGTKSGARLAAD